jgi:hypothetical protein
MFASSRFSKRLASFGPATADTTMMGFASLNPSYGLRAGLSTLSGLVEKCRNRRVGKVNGSRERAPDGVPTIHALARNKDGGHGASAPLPTLLLLGARLPDGLAVRYPYFYEQNSNGSGSFVDRHGGSV